MTFGKKIKIGGDIAVGKEVLNALRIVRFRLKVSVAVGLCVGYCHWMNRVGCIADQATANHYLTLKAQPTKDC